MTSEQISEILNGEYSTMINENDAQSIFGNDSGYQQIFAELSDGYSFDELPQRGISQEQLTSFKNKLDSMNLSIENAQAINQYSNGSNMILSAKRGIPREQIRDGIFTDLADKLRYRGVSDSDISKLQNFVKSIDYNAPLHDSYERTNSFFE